MNRRLPAFAATVAALSLVLSGCVVLAPESTPTATPDTSGVSEELLPFYGQPVEWESCEGGRFDCARVDVPRDWEAPDDGALQIAVIRHRADSGAPLGSLLVNPGGPGVSGVATVRDRMSGTVSAALQESYDVIGFDPRGVGESTAVDCYDGAELDDYLFDLPEGERGSAQREEEIEERGAAFAAACEANSDGILPFISTENAARDMDVLRAVLGDTALNYLGYSWGTALGTAYAELYPERVGRMVLDGALDPTVPTELVGVGQMEGFQQSLEAFLADCLSAEDCPFRGSVDDALADLTALIAAVDARPLAAADGRMLGGDTMMLAVLAALYSPASWPYLRVALASARNGDAAPAFTLADAYYERQGGDYLSNSQEAFPAYNCMDYPLATEEASDAAAQQLEQVAPLAAEYLLAPDLCAQWPYPPTGTRGPASAPGAAPILVIGTTSDPATPYEWSVSLAQQLESALLITRVGEGHTGYNKGNACVDAAVEAYFVDGTVPEGDVRCG